MILAGTGVCGAAIIGYIATPHETQPETPSGHEGDPASDDQVYPAVEVDTSITEQTPSLGYSSIDDVAYACPDFQVSTDQCMAVLDQRYVDESPARAIDSLLSPIMKPNTPMTFGRVFADPAANRRAIEDALSDPVCTDAWPPIESFEGWSGSIRQDLAHRCQADAMAEFSVLVELCAVHSGYGRDEYAKRQRAIEWLDAIEDTEVYWQERAAFEDDHYLKLWLDEKCNRTTAGTLAPLHEYVNTGDSFTDYLNYLGDVNSLRRRAAWLGEGWASAQYKDSSGGLAALYEEALHEADAVRYHVHRAYRLRGKKDALVHVLAASKLASSQGVVIDSEALFQLYGPYGLEELEEANRTARKLLGHTDDARGT